MLLMLSAGLDIELSDFKAKNATLKVDCLRQVVEIMIGAVPTLLEVHFMYLFMSFGRILLQGSMSVDLFEPMRGQVDLRKVQVGIELLGNICLVADRLPPDVHFTLLVGRHPSFSIGFLLYISVLHEFCSQGVGFGLPLFAGSPV